MSTADLSGLVPPGFAAWIAAFEDLGCGVTGEAWLKSLPQLLQTCLERWQVVLDGTARTGQCAIVLPVRRDGEPAVLKLTFPHPEARLEHLALRAWDGDAAVRLLGADPSRWALLLERLDPTRELDSIGIDEACAVVGTLLRRLDRPALPQLDRLSVQTRCLVRRLASPPAGIPRRLVGQARALASDLADDEAVDTRMVHTDLHGANVLAGAREPWLAIDPKPLAAEPAYAVAPMLWNRWPEAVGSADVRGHLRRRVAVICEHAGIDVERARAWTVVREVANALEAAEEDDEERITVAVTIVKAMTG